ncbi:glycosylphosphatidylinositol anchor attachment 1 protein isoform X2 [Eucalyptus grandis]|uniref:glycosylphosphatidylinositol anchor attachment 1 protein isoform X2 n=1 Tax=Eucalyptus grandis TaxID=71139 RepID=UPI00192ED24F|nr:glycosylphosphatidylinositol anchor attachment 1 protein isoform X2 [Eucalyptus grandis]
MAEASTSKPKPRPIVRLGTLLISHSLLVSVVCCVSGVLALLLLPVLAKNTYISENALMPGSASPMLSNQDVSDANRLVNDLSELSSRSNDAGIVQRLIGRYISDLGGEVGYHQFYPDSSRFHPLHLFSVPDTGIVQENINCSCHGISVTGIVRAPRGDGKEAIVLVTPYNYTNAGLADHLSLGIAYSVFSLLSQVTWLAKDIVWLIADSQCGEYASVAAWLRDYHSPTFSGFRANNSHTCDVITTHHDVKENVAKDMSSHDSFIRAGTMAAALVVKVVDRNEPFEDSLGVYAEASNGQMPNLDLINIVNYLGVHRQGLRVKVRKLFSLLDTKWVSFLAEVLESLGSIARRLNPQWNFGIPAADYVDGTATLFGSLYHQALGVPTGPHGAFRDYQVDAVTLEFSPRHYSISKGRTKDFILRGGRLIEGVIRSVNNLLEKFHQSFFLYLLTSPSKFVSVGVYMIAFALLVAPLPVAAASLYAEANCLDTSLDDAKSFSPPAATINELVISERSWRWIKAVKKVLIVHLWGTTVSLLPYFISQTPSLTPITKLAVWGLFSVVCLLFPYFLLGSPFAGVSGTEEYKHEWALLKSATISAAFIGLGLMSVINFATAEFGALLMVPMCLMVQPLKLDLRARTLKNLARAAINLVLAIVGFPPATYYILKRTFSSFDSINIEDFWWWVESLWSWNSATYLFLGMVHLPCWLLCVQILLHS